MCLLCPKKHAPKCEQTALHDWRDLKYHPLCAVIRYRTTEVFAVSGRACGLCCRVSLWLINALFICLHVCCPEHLLQPSLVVFIVNPTQFTEARIALVHCYLAYPAQNAYFFLKLCGFLHWLIWNVSLLDLNVNRRTSTAVVRTSAGNKSF